MEDSDEMRMLAADFEIGHMLRDSIVPKAVLYYTGEVADEDDGEVRRSFLEKNYPINSTLFLSYLQYDEEEEDEDEEDDDDDDDDHDDDEHEGHAAPRGGHHHHGSGGKHGPGGVSISDFV